MANQENVNTNSEDLNFLSSTKENLMRRFYKAESMLSDLKMAASTTKDILNWLKSHEEDKTRQENENAKLEAEVNHDKQIAMRGLAISAITGYAGYQAGRKEVEELQAELAKTQAELAVYKKAEEDAAQAQRIADLLRPQFEAMIKSAKA